MGSPENSDNEVNNNAVKETISSSPESSSRRKFLGKVGGITAVTGAILSGPIAGSGEVLAAAGNAISDEGFEADRDGRVERARRIRIEAANREASLGNFPHPRNGDEERFSTKIGNFSKTMRHNDLGEVDRRDYNDLLRALRSGRFEDIEAIPKAGTMTFANPLGGLAFNMEGPDSPATRLVDLRGRTLIPPSIASAGMAAQMVENYWMAVCRDVPHVNYDTDPLIAKAVADMNRLSGYTGPQPVTSGNLFRYDYPGALVGPMVSQFLFKEFRFDGMLLNGKTRVPLPVVGGEGIDFLSFYDEWLWVLRGTPDETQNPFGYPILPRGVQRFDPTPRWPRTVRDLGQVANQDTIYSVYFRAAVILGGFGSDAIDDGNPYKGSNRQSGFATHGLADLLRLVGGVHQAERHTWFDKWITHRYIRPDVFSGRVHNHVTGRARYPLHHELLRSSVLEEIFKYNELVNRNRGNGMGGSFLQPTLGPTGSPSHPSAPAGHAVSAGACVTILKAWFDEDFPVPNPIVPDADGIGFTPYTGPTLTIGGELNKLCHNLSAGRDMSGVHWRFADDLSGNLQGEEVAIRILREAKPTYPEGFTLSLTKFSGEKITI